MKLRNRLIITWSLIAALCITIASIGIYKVEEIQVVQNSEYLANTKLCTLKESLKFQILNLKSYCVDWAVWDDTYNFVENLNEEYVQSNLVDDTFFNMQIHGMIFVNRKGEIVYSKFFDPGWNKTEIPEEILENLDVFMVYEQVDKLMLLERPIILVSSPILRSDGSGEARGWLIMAKYLDESWVESMQNLINAQIHFSEMKNTIGPKTTWTGKIDSIPITIEFENPFYNQFLSTFLYFEIAAVAGILLGSGFFAFLADRYGIRRILKLTDSVTRGEKAEEDKKNDEISTLIKNYNDLLEKLRSSEEEVRFLLRVMRHDVANALTGAISYLEYLKELHEKAEFERERVENIIEKINTSLWRIHRILKTIKELEASETSKYRISEVVRAVAQYHEVEVEIKGDAMITADDGIYEVFENLTSNAVKHGNATKIFVEVIENDWVDIYFWDNGRGLPEEAWEWFSSIDKLPSLGMLIIKKFVEKYGGSFDFVEGSRFHIRLPKKLGLQ